jgi:hypothetical protein
MRGVTMISIFSREKGLASRPERGSTDMKQHKWASPGGTRTGKVPEDSFKHYKKKQAESQEKKKQKQTKKAKKAVICKEGGKEAFET